MNGLDSLFRIPRTPATTELIASADFWPHQSNVNTCTAMLCLALTFTMKASEQPGAWTGNYLPCDRHTELLKHESMDLGVRFSMLNGVLEAEFARAMNFWATILDMEWHREDSRDCAIQIVDGYPGLFKSAEAARAQFPGTRSFQGWIAFNPRSFLPASELFVIAVHELGTRVRTAAQRQRVFGDVFPAPGRTVASRCRRPRGTGNSSQSARRGSPNTPVAGNSEIGASRHGKQTRLNEMITSICGAALVRC